MTNVKFITVSELKQRATAMVTEVEKTGGQIIITRNGKPVALLRKVIDTEFSVEEEKKRGK